MIVWLSREGIPLDFSRKAEVVVKKPGTPGPEYQRDSKRTSPWKKCRVGITEESRDHRVPFHLGLCPRTRSLESQRSAAAF